MTCCGADTWITTWLPLWQQPACSPPGEAEYSTATRVFCLYLEQCSMERLIHRSPNNSNGDGIVCDWCGFVTLYVCVCACVWVREREKKSGVIIYLCQLKTDADAAWILELWIIDEWLRSCSNELACYYKQWDWSVAVNYWSSICQCQYPAFNTVCIYAYFIKPCFIDARPPCVACFFPLLFVVVETIRVRQHQASLTHLLWFIDA